MGILLKKRAVHAIGVKSIQKEPTGQEATREIFVAGGGPTGACSDFYFQEESHTEAPRHGGRIR
jgi:hypothetical protein